MSELGTLHVVTVISNTERYKSRYRLASDFLERMRRTPHVKVHLVEAAFGDRPHELEHGSKLALRIRSNAWIKENMINLGVRHLLPSDWKYMAWVDADVDFRSEHWADETLHQLQHFAVVQPWQHCADLGPLGSIMQTHTSFGFLHQQGKPMQRRPGDGYQYGHSGYAWACTRHFFEQVEGLIDFAILGSGDHHMAWGAVGQIEQSANRLLSDSYRRRLLDWQRRAVRVSHGEVGFCVGRIEHHWHGKKIDRRYRERWQILVDHKFDPDTDLMRDDQGCFHIVGKPKLEADIRKYNRMRNEDSADE